MILKNKIKNKSIYQWRWFLWFKVLDLADKRKKKKLNFWQKCIELKYFRNEQKKLRVKNRTVEYLTDIENEKICVFSKLHLINFLIFIVVEIYKYVMFFYLKQFITDIKNDAIFVLIQFKIFKADLKILKTNRCENRMQIRLIYRCFCQFKRTSYEQFNFNVDFVYSFSILTRINLCSFVEEILLRFLQWNHFTVFRKLRVLFDKNFLIRRFFIDDARCRTLLKIRRHYNLRRNLKLKAFESHLYYQRFFFVVSTQFEFVNLIFEQLSTQLQSFRREFSTMSRYNTFLNLE